MPFRNTALQAQGAALGPAPVTAEELEAIMKGAGQQTKPRRKKQKTEAASVSAANNQQQLPEVREQPADPGQLAAALGAGHSAAALRAGQTLRPSDQDPNAATDPLQSGVSVPARLPGSQATAHQATLQPTQGGQQAQAAAVSPAMPPPPRASGPAAASPAGWGQQPMAPAAAPQHVAGGVDPYSPPATQGGRRLAMPAESQGGSMASDSAWGTEEERAQRRLQRQAEKQRMK